MELMQTVDQADLATKTPVAESDQFAVYALGRDTYLLVQRHGGTPWNGIRLSGDGLFRVGGLLVNAMRDLYRDVSSDLSPGHGARTEN
jgi:hypothetical protein